MMPPSRSHNLVADYELSQEAPAGDHKETPVRGNYLAPGELFSSWGLSSAPEELLAGLPPSWVHEFGSTSVWDEHTYKLGRTDERIYKFGAHTSAFICVRL